MVALFECVGCGVVDDLLCIAGIEDDRAQIHVLYAAVLAVFGRGSDVLALRGRLDVCQLGGRDVQAGGEEVEDGDDDGGLADAALVAADVEEATVSRQRSNGFGGGGHSGRGRVGVSGRFCGCGATA